MGKEIRNIGASVRARLLNLSRTTGQSFDLVLTRFALERLSFRSGAHPEHLHGEGVESMLYCTNSMIIDGRSME